MIATILDRAGLLTPNPRLADLLRVSTQTAFIELAESREAGEDRLKNSDSYLAAVVFFAERVTGKDSEETMFARGQLEHRGRSRDMTEKRIRSIVAFGQPDMLTAIRQAPQRLVRESETIMRERPPKCRRRAALRLNTAVSVALITDLLCKPGELFCMRTDAESGRPIHPRYDEAVLGPLPLSDPTLATLEARRQYVGLLEIDRTMLFPGVGDAPQLERSICHAVGKLLSASSLEGLKLSILRDLGAVLLLRQNPRALGRVAALLGGSSVVAVENRHSPFLRDPR